MIRSATPIINLEIEPPIPQTGVSLKGLLKAVPVAIGIVLVIPTAIFLQFILKISLPNWWIVDFSRISQAADATFRRGPFLGIAFIWLASFLVILVHEAGHALVVTVAGWKIVEFRAAPFSLRKEDSKWKVHFGWNFWPPGLVLPDSTSVRFHSKLRLIALAGPFANLATGVLATKVSSVRGESILSTLLIIFGTWSIATGLLNLLPIRIRNLELDGYIALVVCGERRRLSARLAAVKMRQYVLSNKPLELMNQRWVALAEGIEKASLQNIGGMWLAYSYWVERKKFDNAAPILEKCWVCADVPMKNSEACFSQNVRYLRH